MGFSLAAGVATNALVADLDRGEPGVPYHVVLRGILNASTVEEAVSAIVRARRAASANYLVASAEGKCRAQQNGSHRPELPPARLTQANEVVNALSESAKDVSAEERTVAFFGPHSELVIEVTGERSPTFTFFGHETRLAAPTSP